jgi:tRNA-dihydrouridine synthase B
VNSEPKILLAPLQGFTDFHFRNAHKKYFGDIDEYYSPWIKLNGEGNLKNAQIRDVKPENNKNQLLIPQIMCNNSDDFLKLSEYLFDIGYQEINWNLGCPYPMVTKRGMGSALLKSPDKILSILDEVSSKIKNKLSLKIRLGFENEDDAFHLLPKLNDFPLSKIIIHARIAKQMYKGKVNLDAFEKCTEQSNQKLVFNGDIDSYQKYLTFKIRFPQIENWMIGRGIIANPFLPGMIKNQTDTLPTNYKEIFSDFHQNLFNEYGDHLSGDKHLLLKMLGFWQYFSNSFKDSHKAFKRIKKAKNLGSYHEAVKINMSEGFSSEG